MNKKVKVVGAGLAGAEAAYYLAERGVKVELYDIKPKTFTPAHTDKNFCELVCSNSLKGKDPYSNACGLLKEEMRILGSLTMEAAENTFVPAGGALAVERESFAQYVTQKLKSHKNIKILCEEVVTVPEERSIIATGPLTTDKLSESISDICGGAITFLRRFGSHSFKRQPRFRKLFFRRQIRQGRRRLYKLPAR